MGQLEDELARLEQELAAFDTARVSSSARERQRHLKRIVEAIHRGEDTSEFDPADVGMVRAALEQYSPAAERVVQRLSTTRGHLGEDGGWRADAQT